MLKKLIYKYKHLLIWVIFLALVFLYWQSYQYEKELIQETDQSQRYMVEQNIMDALGYADNSYKILENYLNQEMREISQILVQKYQEQPDIHLVQGISFYKTNQDGSEVGLVTRGEGPYLDTNISGQEKDLVQEAVLSKEPQVLAFIFILFQIVLVHLFRRTKELASVDVLTKLPNRKMLQERFKRITSQPGQRKVSHKLALLFMDLNEFKAINDNYGHHIGDAVLQEVAGILQSVLRSEDIVVRAGGDEFMALLTGVASKQDVHTVVLKIKEALLQPMLIEGYSIGLQVSVGISMYPDDARSLQELTKMADAAMYRAKSLKTEQISYKS